MVKMHLPIALFSLIITTIVAAPIAKDIKALSPGNDLSTHGIGDSAGVIGVDKVDLSKLRVDPVSLSEKRDIDLEEVDKRSHIRVDPVDIDVQVIRPSPHAKPSKSELNSGEDSSAPREQENENAKSKPKPKYVPKFRLDYDAGSWVNHI
ncbi:hypothetical protein EsH8_VI_001028 [Colletotrichum jinshuiense]